MTKEPTTSTTKSWRTRPRETTTPSSYFPVRGASSEDREPRTVVSYRMAPDELARLAQVGQAFRLNMSESMRMVLARGLDAIEQDTKRRRV